MISILNILILVGLGVIIAVFCVVVGAWVMFRGKSSIPGAGFITGGVPRGEMFRIPATDDVAEFPEEEAEKNILERAEAFLRKLGGKE